jgi:hypothetical protein
MVSGIDQSTLSWIALLLESRVRITLPDLNL